MKNVTIMLVEPQTSGNVGAVARVMANFGFEKLIIVDPLCDIKDKEAVDRAKHGLFVLEKAKVKDMKFLNSFDLVVGTTAKLGNRYNIKRLPLTPKQLAEKIPKSGKVAILFGNEGEGLTNEQISVCDYVVNIPAHKSYPVLNLSHSVSVVLYELFSSSILNSEPLYESIDAQQKKLINEFISKSLPKLGFTDSKKIERQKKTWNQVIAKSGMTKREAFIVMGFLKKVVSTISMKNK